MLTIVLIFIVALAALLHFYLLHQHWKKKNVPFVNGYPFIGAKEIVLFQESIGTYLYALYKKTKDKFIGFYILGKPAILIKDVDLIKQILVKDFQFFDNRTLGQNKIHDAVGSHILFVIPNPDWKPMRRLMSPAFSTGKLKFVVPLVLKSGEDMVAYLRKYNNQPVNVKEVCIKYSTDVITSYTFGLEGRCLIEENSPYWIASKKIFCFTWMRAFSFACYFIAPFLLKPFRLKFLDPTATNIIKNVTRESVKCRQATGVARNFFIDTIVEKKGCDTNLNLPNGDCFADTLANDNMTIGLIAQMFLAGFETVGTTMTMALYEMSKHQDIQNELRQQILEVIDIHEKFSYENIQEMELLDMVVCETLRKYPVLPFLDRKTNTDYTLPGTNISLDKNTNVYISSFGLHYDPQYYPDPEKFDPDRFSPENKKSRNTLYYIPFGEGQRNCIGARFGLLSTKMGLVHILSQYVVLPSKNTPKKMKFNPKGFLLSPLETLYLETERTAFFQRFSRPLSNVVSSYPIRKPVN